MKKLGYFFFVGMLLLPVAIFADASSFAVTKATSSATTRQLISDKNQNVSAKTSSTDLANLTAVEQRQQNKAPNQNGKSVAKSPLVQLELEFRKDTKYSVFSLPNPSRLVIDVKDSQAKTKFDKSSLQNTPVKKVRVAKHSDKLLRIVFDLDRNVTFSTKEEPFADTNAGNNANDKVRLVITLNSK